jgi:molybdopterin-guanine dinucleotide biosynthesis protein A
VFYSILLAGGLSSRMGEDKAYLEFDGQSLLQAGLNLLKDIDSELILLSGRSGYPESVPDILEQCGPPGGLYACLQYLLKIDKLDDSPLLILPVDMPRLKPEILETLLANISEQQGCHFAGEIFPCVLRASEKLRAYLEQIFDESHELGGKRSMRAVLDFCKSKQVLKDSLKSEFFKNINTPEDYEKLLLAE